MPRSRLCSSFSVLFSGRIITRLNPLRSSWSTADEAVLMISSIMRSLASADSFHFPLNSPHFRTFCMNGDNSALNRVSSASSSTGKKTNWSQTFFRWWFFENRLKYHFIFLNHAPASSKKSSNAILPYAKRSLFISCLNAVLDAYIGVPPIWRSVSPAVPQSVTTISKFSTRPLTKSKSTRRLSGFLKRGKIKYEVNYYSCF